MRKNRIILSVLLLSVVLSLAGCVSPSSGKFRANSLPDERYLVGGGFSIEYVAPADGTVYWVEETTEKILQMKSVASGEKVEFGSEGMDPEEVKKVLGIELKDAKFTLYFIPG
jgi:hypothetical protein